jgi:hypothetical protein
MNYCLRTPVSMLTQLRLRHRGRTSPSERWSLPRMDH